MAVRGPGAGARWAVLLAPRSIRMRLTLLYSALFMVAGTALLGFTYFLATRSGPSASVSGSVRAGEAGLPATGPDPPQLTMYAEALRADQLHRLLIGSAVALAVMTCASVALGWLMAGRVLAPLRTMTAAARRISADNLGRRLAVPGPDDELKAMADTFDGVLARLEDAFEAQRRFVANASHELRTPLTLQQAIVDVALADPGASAESLRAACLRVRAAGREQERLIEALLTLARGQGGIQRRERMDLAEVVRERLVETGYEGATGAGSGRAAAGLTGVGVGSDRVAQAESGEGNDRAARVEAGVGCDPVGSTGVGVGRGQAAGAESGAGRGEVAWVAAGVGRDPVGSTGVGVGRGQAAGAESGAGRGQVAQVAADVGRERAAQAAVGRPRVEARLEPAPVRGDPQLIERLVANLVDNAVRHNVPEGWVSVWTGVHQGHAALRFTNSGPVIPPERAPELFRPFQRLGAERVRSRTGLGLGLSIVAAVAAAHGGRVVARPRPQGGLTVEVSLPSASPSAE
ncbi:sensor histidine kinase [Streptomyces sp. NPDC059785]|uniref:sensor histidine kinase n=1 Tax=Streptomyces sp. NPDC059785 TaxID=3346945 RepID=UPI003647A0CE